ncbi:MAG: hypothetical protein HYY23_18420 [Verrucomicrobia bacterium]|nr:hypothetical protein [Verrucomicrobiota bacterium]
MQLPPLQLVLLLVLLAADPASAAPAAQTQEHNRQLQQSLNDSHVHSSWIYNDVDAGFAEAKKTGKPLLVVFR